MRKIFSLFFLIVSFYVFGNTISWSTPPETLSTAGVNASNPAIGTDANGNSFALWLENGFVKGKALPFNGTWTPAITLSLSGASAPQLAVDPQGNATAIWVENGFIKTVTKPFNQGLGTVRTLSIAGSSAPAIAADSSGNLVTIWVTNGVIQSATKLFNQNWSLVPDTLSIVTASDSPQVAIGDNGAVIAVWHAVAPISLTDTIYAARKTIGGIWTAAQTISTASQNSAYPQIAVDSNGNASAIWFGYNTINSTYFNVCLQYSALDPNGFVWSSPVNLSSPGLRNPADLVSKIVYDSVGNSIAVWTTSFDDATFVVESMIKSANGSWSDVADLAADLYAQAVDVAITSSGSVFGVYVLTDMDTSNIVIQTATSQIGGLIQQFWAFPTNISQNPVNISPSITSLGLGAMTNYAAAVWVSYDGQNRIVQASIGSGNILQPPSNLAVVQHANQFGAFTEYYNIFSWDPSEDPLVIGYVIYRNGILLTQTSSTSEIIDHNRKQNGPVTYGIASIAADSSQSTTLTVSFP